MGCEFFIGSIIDPDSYVFGAVTLAASIGTIATLIFTIYTVRKSSNEALQTSYKSDLDSIFSSLEKVLSNLYFHRAIHAQSFTFNGRNVLNYFYDSHLSCLRMFKEGSHNLSVIDQYLHTIIQSRAVIEDRISRLENDIIKKYYTKQFEIELHVTINVIKSIIDKALKECSEEVDNMIRSTDKDYEAMDVKLRLTYKLIDLIITSLNSGKEVDLDDLQKTKTPSP